MKALGLIETKGLLSAVVALDSMLKAANVELKSKIFVGEGLVEISVEGGVDAVKTSVFCAVGALKDKNTLVSYHVIPRAYDDVVLMFNDDNNRLKVEGISTFSTNIMKNGEKQKVTKGENQNVEVKQEVKKEEPKVENKNVELKEEGTDGIKNKNDKEENNTNGEIEKKENPEKVIEKNKVSKSKAEQTLNKEVLSAFAKGKLRALGKRLSIDTGNKKLNNMEKDELIEAILKKINKK